MIKIFNWRRSEKDIMHNRKGMAIATDTVVYIILAVVVLTVLLFWFNSEAGRTQTRTDLISDQTRLCSQYTGVDPTCAGSGSQPKTFAEVSKLIKTCKDLKTYTYCNSGSNNLYCVQQCCFTCPKKPPSPTAT